MKQLALILFAVLISYTGSLLASGDAERGQEQRTECIDCHGEESLGDEEYPRLAGKDEAYLLEQMRLIKKGERSEKAEMMFWFFEDLEDQDLQDLAAYFASLEVE